MVRLILVRHGRSMANDARIFAGHYNADLHPLGEKQAQKTAEYLQENYSVDKVYASDLTRAFRTGQYIAQKLGVDIEPRRNLREIDAGEWDGLPVKDIIEIYSEDYNKWRNDTANCRCTGGESVVELADRIMGELNAIADCNEDKTVVVATHATPIRVAVTMVKYQSIDKMNDVEWAKNASVTLLTRDNGKWNVTLEGYDAHLEEINSVLNQ